MIPDFLMFPSVSRSSSCTSGIFNETPFYLSLSGKIVIFQNNLFKFYSVLQKIILALCDFSFLSPEFRSYPGFLRLSKKPITV